VHIPTDDGWVLRGEVLSPPGPAPPRAVAVLAHAMMADRRTMDRPRGEGLASTLARRGVEVYLMDLRGHGESGPTAREGGSYLYDDFIHHDIPCLVGAAKMARPDLPVAIVGHSLGGHATLAAAGLYPDRAPDLLVGIAANMWVRHTEPDPFRRAAKGLTLGAWAAVARLGGRFDPRWLGSRADAEPWPYVSQFAAMYRRNCWSSADGRVDYEDAARHAVLDILSISSEGDRFLAEPEVVRRFFSMAERSTITYRVVRDGELGGRAPGHMGLVTDRRCVPLWEEIAAFVLAGKRRPSPRAA
jgi:predicted alpha/beta hydrolase